MEKIKKIFFGIGIWHIRKKDILKSLRGQKKVYINLAEFYDEEDDQAKSEKFRRLAENL